MITELSKGRTFPDFAQKINVAEIRDKKRMIIADEMGMGKSASAILAKETLNGRCHQALVIVPSNTVDTWENYLSDRVEDGKQIGYFLPGKAPKVKIIEKASDLDGDCSEYEYIVIAQEKLTENEGNKYLKKLTELPYSMIIADEIHKLKNLSEGKRSKGFLRILKKIENDPNGYLVLLSGTPVPNKVRDVAMLLLTLYPEEFGDMGAKELGKSILSSDLVKDLRTLLAPRMQKKAIHPALLGMPERPEDIIVPVELSQRERDIYEIILEEDELSATEKIGLLRKFLLNPELINHSEGFPDGGSKYQAFRDELFETIETSDKILVFANDFME